MSKVLDRLEAKVNAKDTPVTPEVIQKGVAPGYVRQRGEKPFSFNRFLGALGNTGSSRWDAAQTEQEVCRKFYKGLQDTGCLGFNRDSGGYWLPINIESFGDQLLQRSETEADMTWVKGIMQEGLLNGARSTDPEETAYLLRKGILRKASNEQAYDNAFGGDFIAPPTQGDVIPLVRPEATVLAAGASTLTLPPSGRFVRPRITTAPAVTAVAEGNSAAQGDMGTDMMQLTAKKIAGYVVISDEASQYTSGSIDNWVRQELNKSLGLQFDAYAMYGTGGPNIPAGLKSPTYAGTNQVIDFAATYTNAKGVQPNGNILLPQYCDGFEGLIGERSFNMDSSSAAYVMRPGTWATVTAARADAVTPGDAAGPRVDLLRRTEDKAKKMWDGRKVIRSTNIDNTQTKGTGTALTDMFYGIWQHMVVATYGAIQFQDGYINAQLVQGLKTLKATMYGDIGLYYPGAFLYYKNLIGVTNVF